MKAQNFRIIIWFEDAENNVSSTKETYPGIDARQALVHCLQDLEHPKADHVTKIEILSAS